jgi:hypothetical protein
MRTFRVFKILAALSLGLFAALSLAAQTKFASGSSLSLRLSGPVLVRAGDRPHFRAFLVNDSKINVEIPISSADAVSDLNWTVVDDSSHRTYSRPAGRTFCNFGKYFPQQNFLVLRPGQRMELIGIEIPENLLRRDGKGLYRISLRYSPSVFVLPDEGLKEKPLYNLTSNEMKVVLTEF